MKSLKQLLPLLLTLFILSPELVRAESDHKNGYYISASGDTIQGLIIFESGQDNYTICRYKASENAERQNFGPDQIRGYSIEGKRLFISHTVKIQGESITAFFEVLLQGEVTLYKYRERFYLENNNQLKWLHIDESKEEKEGIMYTSYSKHHITILMNAFTDCPELKRKMAGGKRVVLIREKNLVRLIEDYYACAGKEFIAYKKKSSQGEDLAFSRLRIGLHAGMSLSSIYMTQYFSNISLVTPNFDFGRPLTYGAGLSFEYSSPRVNDRVSFVVEPYFQQIDFQGFTERLTSETKIEGNLSLKFKEIVIPFGVKYIILTNWNDFHISLGLLQRIYFDQELISSRKVEDLSDGSITDSQASLMNIRKNHFGGWLGTGILLVKQPKIRIPLQVRFQSLGQLVEPFRSSNPVVSFKDGYYTYLLFLLGVQF